MLDSESLISGVILRSEGAGLVLVRVVNIVTDELIGWLILWRHWFTNFIIAWRCSLSS